VSSYYRLGAVRIYARFAPPQRRRSSSPQGTSIARLMTGDGRGVLCGERRAAQRGLDEQEDHQGDEQQEPCTKQTAAAAIRPPPGVV
jgi:hypothetical protein